MAIKKAKKNDENEEQKELQVQSRDEKLSLLLEMETDIQTLKGQEEQHKAAASGFKGQIKDLEAQKVLLVNQLNVLAAVESLCRDVAKEHGIPMYKQNPGTIKLVAAGHGKASKEEVMEAAMKWWGILPGGIIDDNHSDALAAAYTWLKKATEARQKVKR